MASLQFTIIQKKRRKGGDYSKKCQCLGLKTELILASVLLPTIDIQFGQ